MKLILTSVGLSTEPIRDAMVSLTGKALGECRAVLVPTAIYASPDGPTGGALTVTEVAGYGWAELGVVELTALPTLPAEYWSPAVESADVIIVSGGNGGYLSHWMFESCFADVVRAQVQRGAVYLGISAGSMMATVGYNVHKQTLQQTGRYYDDEYDEYAPDGAGSDRALGLVDFVVRPHYLADYYPALNRDLMLAAAAKVAVPLYAIDDDTAIAVHDGVATVVGDGSWELFAPEHGAERAADD